MRPPGMTARASEVGVAPADVDASHPEAGTKRRRSGVAGRPSSFLSQRGRRVAYVAGETSHERPASVPARDPARSPKLRRCMSV